MPSRARPHAARRGGYRRSDRRRRGFVDRAWSDSAEDCRELSSNASSATSIWTPRVDFGKPLPLDGRVRRNSAPFCTGKPARLHLVTRRTRLMTLRKWLAGAGICAMAAAVVAGVLVNSDLGPLLLGIRAEFLLFALTLLGVALFHHRTLEVALTGLVAILSLKLLTDPAFELGHHFLEEAQTLTNLLGLLLGFAVLARHFEESQVPEILPRFLPDDWKGGFMLLAMVFVL